MVRGALRLTRLLPALVALPALFSLPSPGHAEAPVFAIDHAASTVAFRINGSRPIEGRFKSWKASLAFTAPEASTAVLDVTIDTASVDSGSTRRDRLLKGGQGFDVKAFPVARFHSTRIARTGPQTFAVTGDFTLKGITRPETLMLKLTRAGSAGQVTGDLSFNRKDFGITANAPFIKIADRVDVLVDVRGARVSGPPVTPDL